MSELLLPVDLRSDTVTKPTPAMRKAMANAEVGDDVLGDDPTVIKLQERVAELLGKEAALYVPSGSMGNHTSIRAHTESGDEIICHEMSHIYHYEAGAPAGLSGCSLRLLHGSRGRFAAADVRRAIRPANSNFPKTAQLKLWFWDVSAKKYLRLKHCTPSMVCASGIRHLFMSRGWRPSDPGNQSRLRHSENSQYRKLSTDFGK